jgi:hypothetical protein
MLRTIMSVLAALLLIGSVLAAFNFVGAGHAPPAVGHRIQRPEVAPRSGDPSLVSSTRVVAPDLARPPPSAHPRVDAARASAEGPAEGAPDLHCARGEAPRSDPWEARDRVFSARTRGRGASPRAQPEVTRRHSVNAAIDEPLGELPS